MPGLLINKECLGRRPDVLLQLEIPQRCVFVDRVPDALEGVFVVTCILRSELCGASERRNVQLLCDLPTTVAVVLSVLDYERRTSNEVDANPQTNRVASASIHNVFAG